MSDINLFANCLYTENMKDLKGLTEDTDITDISSPNDLSDVETNDLYSGVRAQMGHPTEPNVIASLQKITEQANELLKTIQPVGRFEDTHVKAFKKYLNGVIYYGDLLKDSIIESNKAQ